MKYSQHMRSNTGSEDKKVKQAEQEAKVFGKGCPLHMARSVLHVLPPI